MSYKAVIFDFDYTLADATKGIVVCYNYAFTKCGFSEQDIETIRKTIGMTVPNAFSIMTGCKDKEITEVFREHFRRMADKIMAENTILYPHTKDLIKKLSTKGIKTGVVTTKFRYRIKEVFERENLLPYVDVIIGFEDVDEPKPAPDGVNMALENLSLSSDQILYVGDNIIDAQTAENAGVDFAGVLTGTTTKQELEKYKHEFISENLEELDKFLVKGKCL